MQGMFCVGKAQPGRNKTVWRNAQDQGCKTVSRRNTREGLRSADRAIAFSTAPPASTADASWRSAPSWPLPTARTRTTPMVRGRFSPFRPRLLILGDSSHLFDFHRFFSRHFSASTLAADNLPVFVQTVLTLSAYTQTACHFPASMQTAHSFPDPAQTERCFPASVHMAHSSPALPLFIISPILFLSFYVII